MKATDKGLLKTFSKMGISTLQSYQGADFEAIGLNRALVQKYFTGTSSRIEGVDMAVLAREALMKHEFAMNAPTESDTELRVGGDYQYRVRGEKHLLDLTVSSYSTPSRQSQLRPFLEFAKIVDQPKPRPADVEACSISNQLVRQLPLMTWSLPLKS